MMKFANTVSVA